MNLFVLATNAREAAQRQCDAHVVKMCLETAQILYAVFYLWGCPVRTRARGGVAGQEVEYAPLQKTHEHHPCVLWAAGAKSHLMWTLALGMELCIEFERRRDWRNRRSHRKGNPCGEHKCRAHVRNIQDHIQLHGVPQGMPDTIDVEGWIAWLERRNMSKHVLSGARERVSTVNVPEGTRFGVVAISVNHTDNPEPSKKELLEHAKTLIVRTDTQDIDTVATYERLYAHKAKYEFPVKWWTQFTPPDARMATAIQEYAPHVACLTQTRSKTAKLSESHSYGARKRKRDTP